MNIPAVAGCCRKADSCQPAAGVAVLYLSKADSAFQSRTPGVSESAPGVEERAVFPETKVHRQSRPGLVLNTPSRKEHQIQVLMNSRGVDWGSREPHRSPVLQLALHRARATVVVQIHCHVAPVNSEILVGSSEAEAGRS